MHFHKMHGLGNDFVLVEGSEVPEKNYARLARRLCDRNFGIGADGLIIVLPSDRADIRMRIFNADGSEPEMCGNGIRCFAKYVYENGLVERESFKVETLAGIIIPRLEVKDGRVMSVRVDMGKPRLAREEIPFKRSGAQGTKVVSEPLEAGDRTFYVTAVSMGNPHAVIFVQELDDCEIDKYGPLIEKHPAFPFRTNVEFVQKCNERELKMLVWERGAGRTLACGTGACASVVAAVLNGLTGRKVKVHLSGGSLDIIWNKDDGHVYMTGPAEEVFTGRLSLI